MSKFLQLCESKSAEVNNSKTLSKTKHRYEDKDDLSTFTKVVTAQQYAKEHLRFLKLKQKKA